ncbi:hypothetical protein [Microtetraspora malaysiensis]|uniref:hypothetical protein n=1 Tax=Microtetraspora malaysiensis TaxID=161358 RepID=UPI003D8E5490
MTIAFSAPIRGNPAADAKGTAQQEMDHARKLRALVDPDIHTLNRITEAILTSVSFSALKGQACSSSPSMVSTVQAASSAA